MSQADKMELKRIHDAVGPLIARLEKQNIPTMAWSDMFTLMRLANQAGRIQASEEIYERMELFRGKDPDEDLPKKGRRTRCRNPDI